MPVIQEEDVTSDMGVPDFSELLELPDISFGAFNDLPIGMTVASDPMQPLSPSLLEPTEYAIRFLNELTDTDVMLSSGLCNDFMGDWTLPEPAAGPYLGLEEPDYAKFENVRLPTPLILGNWLI